MPRRKTGVSEVVEDALGNDEGAVEVIVESAPSRARAVKVEVPKPESVPKGAGGIYRKTKDGLVQR